MTSLTPRPARTTDVARIRALIEPYSEQGILVAKEAVDYYEAVQEFVVVDDPERPGELLGCGALHVLWEDLGEVRTLATSPRARGRGVGTGIVDCLLDRARGLGLTRIFCLTFETEFFRARGFEVMDNQESVPPEIFAELLRSHDTGVAEFLDLARVKPNTLGNTRMIRGL